MEIEIELTKKELCKLEVLTRLQSGQLSNKQAALALGISDRQLRRLKKRYDAQGGKGLAHQGRGKSSNREDVLLKTAALLRYRESYEGFGPTLASEKLHERDGLEVDHETLRRWLIAAGLWEGKKRRKKHRSRRERKKCFGEMVQFDGSPHKWFENRGPRCTLMVMIDDATGEIYAYFSEEETTEAAMYTLWGWIERYGLPLSLYLDKRNAYKILRETTIEEQLAGIKPVTDFQRACDRLGIEIITAHSAQAKGRVERMNGTLQDRLVKEMRLIGIRSINEGNKFLQEEFLSVFNRKFRVEASQEENLHVKKPSKKVLREIFCREWERKVSNDFVIRFHNRLFQIKKGDHAIKRPGMKVIVRGYLDGSHSLIYQDKKIPFKEITQKVKSRKMNQQNRE